MVLATHIHTHLGPVCTDPSGQVLPCLLVCMEDSEHKLSPAIPVWKSHPHHQPWRHLFGLRELTGNHEAAGQTPKFFPILLFYFPPTECEKETTPLSAFPFFTCANEDTSNHLSKSTRTKRDNGFKSGECL